MGKKSIKENKNIYQLSRENLGLTREAASELLESISSDRIEKIENERPLPHPDEVLQMSIKYKNPHLCNYYCANECEIGRKYIPEVSVKNLSQIVLEILANLNTIEGEKNRLIEIASDGNISEDEYTDFTNIKEKLSQIAHSVNALQLWIEKTIADGHISQSEDYKHNKQFT